MLLHEVFFGLVKGYCDDGAWVEKLWEEIASRYSATGRHYHTLEHLGFMLSEFGKVRTFIRNWDTNLFALFYHDAVYVPGREDNEKQSAALAAMRLDEIGFPQASIEKTVHLILATKDHSVAAEGDTAYFLDADLASGLGRSPEAHREVIKQVRREYEMYSDAVFGEGRMNFVRHLLEMPRIFKTQHFHEQFEHQARENMRAELSGRMSE
jgi:predicted metal-dependent HD superfamily phosphohydrolase